jgi:hypothetical protein
MNKIIYKAAHKFAGSFGEICKNSEANSQRQNKTLEIDIKLMKMHNFFNY